jgi:hypothetical protein
MTGRGPAHLSDRSGSNTPTVTEYHSSSTLRWSPAARPAAAPERPMTRKSVSMRARTAAHNSNHVPDLINRIATGDRAAFQRLYGVLAMRVWRQASQLLPQPVDSRVVTRATFVEVWHLARHHLDDSELEMDAWIAAITVQRVEDRLRSIGRPSLARDDDDRHTYREFAAMIGGDGPRSGSTPNRSSPYVELPEPGGD